MSDKTKQLTRKQQLFVDFYDGDIKATAKKVKMSHDYCRRLLNQQKIAAAIRNRQDEESRINGIATRQERQKFWTEVMNGKVKIDDNVIKGGNLSDRLKASELLGKSEADFTDKHLVSGKASLLDILGRVGAEE